MLRGMSHPEYQRWQIWLHEQWNQPSRADYQQAQTAYILWCIWCFLTGSKVKKEFKSFLVTFDLWGKPAHTPISELTPEQADQRNATKQLEGKLTKMAMLAALGWDVPEDAVLIKPKFQGVPSQDSGEEEILQAAKGPKIKPTKTPRKE